MARTLHVENEDHPLIILKELEGNVPTQLYGIQHSLMPYSAELITFWWIVMLMTVVGVLRAAYRSWSSI